MTARVHALSEAADEILRTADDGEVRALVAVARRVVIIGQMAIALDQPDAEQPQVRYCPEELARR
jgi:hypothetical protein